MNSTELFQVEKISKYFQAKDFTDFDFNESNNLIIFYGGKMKKKGFYCNKNILDALEEYFLTSFK